MKSVKEIRDNLEECLEGAFVTDHYQCGYDCIQDIRELLDRMVYYDDIIDAVEWEIDILMSAFQRSVENFWTSNFQKNALNAQTEIARLQSYCRKIEKISPLFEHIYTLEERIEIEQQRSERKPEPTGMSEEYISD